MKWLNFGIFLAVVAVMNATSDRKCSEQMQYIMPFPIGVWLEDQPIHFILNQKQGFNLIFHGYMYKREASYKTTVNWICSNGNGKRASQNKCAARCITKLKGTLKLGKNPHNHPPRFTQDTMPVNLLKAEGGLLLPRTF